MLLLSRLCIFVCDLANPVPLILLATPTLQEQAGKGTIISEGACSCILLPNHWFSIGTVHENQLGTNILTWPGPCLQRFRLNYSGLRLNYLGFQKLQSDTNVHQAENHCLKGSKHFHIHFYRRKKSRVSALCDCMKTSILT